MARAEVVEVERRGGFSDKQPLLIVVDVPNNKPISLSLSISPLTLSLSQYNVYIAVCPSVNLRNKQRD